MHKNPKKVAASLQEIQSLIIFFGNSIGMSNYNIRKNYKKLPAQI